MFMNAVRYWIDYSDSMELDSSVILLKLLKYKSYIRELIGRNLVYKIVCTTNLLA